MGRKSVPIHKRKTDKYYYNLYDRELAHRIQIMARREGVPVGGIVVKALEEFDMRHFDGNYQTLMDSFEAGGIKSEGQLEADVIRYFEGKGRDVTGREIQAHVKGLDIPANRRKIVTENVIKGIKGVKVWR